MIKVLIGYSEHIGEIDSSSTYMPDELHYLYTDNQNMLIDLYLDPSQLSDEEMDEIASSLVIKE